MVSLDVPRFLVKKKISRKTWKTQLKWQKLWIVKSMSQILIELKVFLNILLSRIHIMAGKINGQPTASHHETYLANLKFAAQYLESEGILGVIEPINHYSLPGYYMHDYKHALEVLNKIGSLNLKIMVDLFHMQILNGNIVNWLKEFKSWVGHVQIAQCPDRNEPNTKGELDLKFILEFLEKEIYQDWVGCEYKPKTTSVEGLGWIKEFGYIL